MKTDKEKPSENKLPTLQEAARGAVMRLLTKRMKELNDDDLKAIDEQITKLEKAKFA